MTQVSQNVPRTTLALGDQRCRPRWWSSSTSPSLPSSSLSSLGSTRPYAGPMKLGAHFVNLGPLAWFLTCRCFSVKFLILMITMKSWWSISWWFIQNLAAAAAPPTPCLGRGWVRLCLGGQCCSSKNISRSWRWWWLWSWWQWKWSGSEGGGHDFWISFEEHLLDHHRHPSLSRWSRCLKSPMPLRRLFTTERWPKRDLGD